MSTPDGSKNPSWVARLVTLFFLPACLSAGFTAEPVQLGRADLAGWKKPTGQWQTAEGVSLDRSDSKRLAIRAGTGVIVNGPEGRTSNLLTEAEFGDAEVHIEFCIPSKSNSGVYLMGRYEVQIYDSYRVFKDKYPGIECAGIYPRWMDNHEVEGHSPKKNVSKAPGQWQTLDITFRAPRFDVAGQKIENARFCRVVHNGTVVHENVAVSGPTRAAHWENERTTGPLLLQGDHGPVAFRNIRITPVQLP